MRLIDFCDFTFFLLCPADENVFALAATPPPSQSDESTCCTVASGAPRTNVTVFEEARRLLEKLFPPTAGRVGDRELLPLDAGKGCGDGPLLELDPGVALLGGGPGGGTGGIECVLGELCVVGLAASSPAS